MRRTLALIVAGTLAASVLAGCAPQPAEPEPSAPPSETTSPTPEATTPQGDASAYAWLDTELTDAVTGEKFRLADRKGEPILLHAFAVW